MVMVKWSNLVTMWLGVIVLAEKNIPSYMKVCSLSDQNFGQCTTDSANDAFRNILNGDNDFNISTFMPFFVKSMFTQPSNNLKINLYNSTISGFETMRFEKFWFTRDLKKLEIVASIGKLHCQSQYEIEGRILILPIVGNGDLDIISENVTIAANFNLKVIKKSGDTYLKLLDGSKYTEEVGKMTIELTNLFNGDKNLGDQMNKFLNKNWKVVEMTVGPAFLDVLQRSSNVIISKYFKQLPKGKLFLP